MATEAEYKNKIQSYRQFGLKRLWRKKRQNCLDDDFWESGKLLEYAILRAFELEGAEVTYPYSVELQGEEVEQIDGAIKVGSLYSLIECKDYSQIPINITPLAKLRNQLLRRHASIFGMFFSMSDYTNPAEMLVQYMSPQMIILWSAEDIDYCMEHSCFIPCLRQKYKMAIENCEFHYQYSLRAQI